MIDTSGYSGSMALKLYDSDPDAFGDSVTNDATSQREIAAFKERIGTITTVDELVADTEVYSFVMKAFGMEDEMFGKAMNKQLMTSDAEDDSSLVNRMEDDKYTELNETMGFNTDGTAGIDFNDSEWVDAMVDRYTEQRVIDTQMESNETLGTVLQFRENASSYTSWYEVLADEDASEFIKTALNIPTDSSADIDAQARALEKKMDIEDLQDPEKVEELVDRYVAIKDAEASKEQSSNTIVSLFTKNSSGTYGVQSIDLELIRGHSASAYR
jgi:hypothetical protein